MATKREIRNWRSSSSIPPRLFDVVVDGNLVEIQVKTNKNGISSIPWEDVVTQVEQAVQENKKMAKELPQPAP
ncbi:MAG: hypothetical protein IJ106_01455 [Parasporobacterium sp.]|nr:hypothetical protein [Parasporobacterium sp.]MBQ9613676.1 hypothetical protein [Lachnospiraceae bacterium]